MYTKDFASLLNLLSVSNQSGILRIEPTESDRGDWFALVTLREGSVVACVLLRKQDGREILRGSEVLRTLTAVGPLSWKLESASAGKQLSSPGIPTDAEPRQRQHNEPRMVHPSGALPPFVSEDQRMRRFVPRRTVRGMHGIPAGSWPREHRQVFALVDGRHSVEDLSRLLHKPQQELLLIIRQLRDAGFIEINE